MAYSFFKTPARFVAKFPRKDFIVLAVVIGIVLAIVAAAVINKNKVEIAESFSDLAEAAVNACESYPKIISGKVYGNEKCDCPPKVGEIKEHFGKMNVRKMNPVSHRTTNTQISR